MCINLISAWAKQVHVMLVHYLIYRDKSLLDDKLFFSTIYSRGFSVINNWVDIFFKDHIIDTCTRDL